MDEPLPGQRSLILEQAQFLLGRIGKASTRQSRVPRQQASLDDALHLDQLGGSQVGLVGHIVDHDHTVRHRPPRATPGNPKSVDNWSLREREASVFSVNAAGMQSFATRLLHHSPPIDPHPLRNRADPGGQKLKKCWTTLVPGRDRRVLARRPVHNRRTLARVPCQQRPPSTAGAGWSGPLAYNA